MYRNPLNEDASDMETHLKLCITYKGTSILVVVGDRLKTLKFQEGWFQGRTWPEYTVEDDAVYCFYCQLFRLKVNGK